LRVPRSVKGLGGILDARVEVRGVCARCQQVQETSKKAEAQPDKRGSRA
jgi:hypothetical protein